MIFSDTIFALSSGAGKAGVAVVRVSGPQAGAALRALCGEIPSPRVARYGPLRNGATGEIYDRGLVIWFPGPQSATGEDIAEFHVHGSRAVIEAVFAELSVLPRTRLAVPGEFLQRAFASGKADLVEIEGLSDLLNAETAAQRRLAMRQAGGFSSSIFEDWRKALLSVLAHVEACIDFGDEDDIAGLSARILPAVAGLADAMGAELKRASAARALRQGFRVVLAGHPNTGKSSLLNALARRDAAIVSSRAGTTRDVVEVPLEIDGLLVTLADTAGLRDGTDDEIEQIGIARSVAQLEQADLRIWVWSEDIAGSATPDERFVPDIFVQNKIDAAGGDSGLFRNESSGIEIGLSARTGEGVDVLLGELARMLREKHGGGEGALLVRERQVQAVRESIRSLNDAGRHIDGALEVVAEDLRGAAHALARLTGRIDVEDLLSAIFAEFCIGK